MEDGRTGLVIKKNDATNLAQAIEKLIIDAPLRKQMRSACSLKFEERYTESVFERNMSDCLKNAI